MIGVRDGTAAGYWMAKLLNLCSKNAPNLPSVRRVSAVPMAAHRTKWGWTRPAELPAPKRMPERQLSVRPLPRA
ncbi:hypothetical protein KCP70_08310 [Salmonella enterica subsp. enterica]|nr:hypothetical protein KCP70_08310 [Salmonella enterica subsp. enterica]